MNFIISIFFLLSGITGLVYEVVWAKYLSLVLGNTAYAHTIVLSTFLGGLAIGNGIFGSIADKNKNRLKLYGWLELLIGVLAVSSPFFLTNLSELYLTLAKLSILTPYLLTCLKVVFCSVVLLLPTALMGGTLPCLSRFTTQSMSQMQSSVSWLYFLNSLGAVIGSLIAGFYLIPTFGLNLAIVMTAAVNVAIGILSIALSKFKYFAEDKQLDAPEISSEHTSDTSLKLSPYATKVVFIVIFLSGVLSLTYEVAWIRLLSLILGSSSYSFSIMLAAFIAGIALGSLIVNKTNADPLKLFTISILGIFISIALTLPLYEKLPFLFLLLRGVLSSTTVAFPIFEMLKFFFCISLMIIPTTFIGMTLPLASRIVTKSSEQVATKVGQIFSINTIGNVLGIILSGLWLLPALGIKLLILSGATIHMLCGISLLLLLPVRNRKSTYNCILLIVVFYFGVNWFLPAFDESVLSSGVFRRIAPTQMFSFEQFMANFKNQKILFYEDGKSATVTVTEQIGGIRTLKVNGKPDASTGRDMITQQLLGHLAPLLHTEAKKVLVVGLGSGVTAGAVLQHPISSLDVIEISDSVVRGSKFFEKYNHNCLNDPRLKLYIDDAKSFLSITNNKYDIIISEPSNPWIAGIGNLFSIDFYGEAKNHLTDNGVMVQWFHSYEMNDETLQLVLRTFQAAFPNVTIWNTLSNKYKDGDYLLIGSQNALPIDFTKIKERLNFSGVKNDLEQIGLDNLPTLLSMQTASSHTVRKIAGKGKLNEDLFPILEYEAPKAFFLKAGASLLIAHNERLLNTKKGNTLLSQYLTNLDRPITETEYSSMVDFYYNYGNIDFVSTITNAWLNSYPSSLQPLKVLSQINYMRENYRESLRFAQKLLSIQPNNPEYLLLAGKASMELYREEQNSLYELDHSFIDYFNQILPHPISNRGMVQQLLTEAESLVTPSHSTKELLHPSP